MTGYKLGAVFLIISFFLTMPAVQAQNKLTKREKRQGYKLLYDGKTSTGWRSAGKKTFPEKGWEFRNGELRVLPAEDHTKHTGAGGDIVTVEKFSAFDLSLDYNISPGGNSGLKYFVANEKGSSLGLEFQILDDQLNPDAKAGVNGNHTSASLYDMIASQKAKANEKPAGNWNTIRLVVYPDNRVEHYLNGVKVLEYVKGSAEFKELLAKSKYSKIPGFAEHTEGHLLLQDHGTDVRFKNIKIKKL